MARAVRNPAAILAYRLIDEAVKSVGGTTAWERMAHDAKLDMVRARAWLVVQGREPQDGGVLYAVQDVMDSMGYIYSMESL